MQKSYSKAGMRANPGRRRACYTFRVQCPNCGHTNPEGSRFCNHCGQRLDGGAPPPQADRRAGDLSGLLPEDLADKLKTARSRQSMVGERRVVTMLFCDMAGSTAAAEQLDPEDWAEIVNGAFERMIRPVFQYEGTVARLMGDAILAFFGAPIAHEDDPQRAVLAGLQIVAGIQPYRQRIRDAWEVDFDVRVGINTGLVMVGAVGSDLRMEYTAMGDAINLAARMEQTAEPGTIQVSQATYQRVAPLFEWQPLPPIRVKGKSEPVRAYRPLKPKNLEKNLRGLEGLDSPLTGRAGEWQRLLEAAGEVRSGTGRTVLLIGEAGLGKSRLIRELRSELERGRGWRWLDSASLSYESGQPYAIFRRLLRQLWRLPQEAGLDQVRARLAEAFPSGNDRHQAAVSLLGMESPPETGGLSGEALKSALFSLVSDSLGALPGEGRAAVVLDDLHWADPASAALLAHLLRRLAGAPLLFLCALRPDLDTPAWEALETAGRDTASNFARIHLSPLSDADTRTLLENILSKTRLPAGLQAEILGKTDGNPFFVEEMVRTLIENGVLVRNGGPASGWRVADSDQPLDIPGNLQSLLVARIDRLADDARRTLQLASVIGRSFTVRVLRAILEAIDAAHRQLDEALSTLAQAEMILEMRRVPELEYAFRHALTQETAYGTLLRRQRREFHRRAGEAIESIYHERLDEFAPILARHFGEAGDRRAWKYGVLAGDAAFRLFAIEEATGHYLRVFRALESGGGRWELQAGDAIHLHLRLGRCYELRSQYDRALAVYRALEARGGRADDPHMLLAALLARATAQALPNPEQDTQSARQAADQAQDLADRLDDPQARARLAWAFMLIQIYSGHMQEGIPFGERAVRLAREQGLRDLEAHALQDLGLAYMSTGNLARSEEVLAEATKLWKSLRNLALMAECLANMTYIHAARGDFEAAEKHARQALEISRSIDNVWGQTNARAFIPFLHIVRGEVDRAIELVDKLFRTAEQVGHPGSIAGYFFLSWMYYQLGAFDRARQSAEQGWEKSVHFPPFHPFSQAMMALHHTQAGDLESARQELSEAEKPGPRSTLHLIDLIVDLAGAEYHLAREDIGLAQDSVSRFREKIERSGARLFLPYAWQLQAGVYRQRNDPIAAGQSLERAREVAESVGARLVLWRILAEQGEIEKGTEVARRILVKISDPELAGIFSAYAGSFGLKL